jgi:hypothetical protein
MRHYAMTDPQTGSVTTSEAPRRKACKRRSGGRTYAGRTADEVADILLGFAGRKEIARTRIW